MKTTPVSPYRKLVLGASASSRVAATQLCVPCMGAPINRQSAR